MQFSGELAALHDMLAELKAGNAELKAENAGIKAMLKELLERPVVSAQGAI